MYHIHNLNTSIKPNIHHIKTYMDHILHNRNTIMVLNNYTTLVQLGVVTFLVINI